MWYKLSKIYVGTNLVRPNLWDGGWDFTDWTWDTTKLNTEFPYHSGSYSIATDWFTTSSSASNIWYLVTSDGAKFHSAKLEMEVYNPSWWFAINWCISSVYSSNFSTASSNWFAMRTQDYSSGSYRQKLMSRLWSNLIDVQQYLWNQWVTYVMKYDWSNWAYSRTANWNTIWSWTDSNYSQVAAKMVGDIYIVFQLEQGSGANSVFIKKASYSFE